MRYLVANRKNILNNSAQLLGNNFTLEQEKELLKAKTIGEFNVAMMGHGVEGAKSRSGDNDFTYVNMGDSYLLTIVEYKGKFRICCWGDIVEGNMDDFE